MRLNAENLVEQCFKCELSFVEGIFVTFLVNAQATKFQTLLVILCSTCDNLEKVMFTYWFE
jgi:hypothetical protein